VLPSPIPGAPNAVRVALFLFLALAARAAIAQNPHTQSPASVKVSTEVVNVLAIVRDGSDHLIPNLNQADFELSEDGRPQQITYFSRETDTPLRLGILIDTSPSQRRVLPVEKREAKAFIRQVMRPQDLAFILRFDRRIEPLQPFTGDPELLSQAIDSIAKTAPATRLYDAVCAASDVMKQQEARKVLILLTDGFDTRSHTSLRAATHAAQEADLVIYSIAVRDPLFSFMPLYSLRADRTLKKLSDATGGRVIRVNRGRDVAGAFGEVAQELRTQYLLGYSSSNTPHDGSFRRIRVRLREGNYSVQVRRGYYAPSE